MSCSHTRETSRWVTYTDDWTGEEVGEWRYSTEYTHVDISIGAFRCTQCGEVGYYTGSWKQHYEKGTPCAGDKHPEVNAATVRKAIKDHRNKNEP